MCPNGEPTVDGSGPNNVGTKWPGAKYGLYVLAGIPVKYGFVACLENERKLDRNRSKLMHG